MAPSPALPSPESLQAWGCWNPSPAPDQGSVAYVSDRDGRPRVWIQLLPGHASAGRMPAPARGGDGADLGASWSGPGSGLTGVNFEPMGAATQARLACGVSAWPVETGPEPVCDVSWAPTGERLAVLVAPGGGEHTQVWTVRPDGDDLRPLAMPPGGSASFVRWTGRGEVLLVAETSVSGVTEAVLVDAATGSREVVAAGPLLRPAAVSRDHATLLLRRGPRGARRMSLTGRGPGSDDERPLLADLPGSTDYGILSPDGETAYLLSDAGRDRPALLAVRRRVAVSSGTTARRHGVTPEDGRRRLAWPALRDGSRSSGVAAGREPAAAVEPGDAVAAGEPATAVEPGDAVAAGEPSAVFEPGDALAAAEPAIEHGDAVAAAEPAVEPGDASAAAEPSAVVEVGDAVAAGLKDAVPGGRRHVVPTGLEHGGPDAREYVLLAERDDAELDQFALTPDGRRAVLVWNEHGRSTLAVLDTGTGAVTPLPPPPADVVTSIRMSLDGATAFMAAESSDQPSHVLLCDLATGRYEEVAGLGRLAHAPRAELIEIKAHDGLDLAAWLYRPPSVQGPAPYLVYLHGGPEDQERPTFNPLYHNLLAAGIGVLAPNVRGSSGHGRAFREADDRELRFHAVEDVADCATELVRRGVADPGRLACMGWSYGGYLTLAALVTHPRLFRTGVDVSGMSDLESFYAHTEPWIAAAAVGEYGHPEKDRDLLRALSPLRRFDRLEAPLFVVHGVHDTNVPVHEAEQAVRAARARGVMCEELLFPDEGHEIRRAANRAVFVGRVVGWLTHHLLAPHH
ncbi:prolyl oligopeptidase family serine peptidase [Nonomuraea sp. NPDC050786]|uniref:S9 family peptidase n=1 Tax=Nonomuraea sp. NPDC050786 TaxID=3154840 RepID=UPI0033C3BE92